MLLTGGSFWCICMLSLRYHFIQLDNEIRMSIKQCNINNTSQLIVHHKQIELDTYWLNKEFGVHFYIVYKFLKPVLNLLIYLTHARDTKLVSRFLFMMISTAIIYFKIMLSYLASSVMTSAHRPRTALYSSVMTRDNNMSMKAKLKIIGFIERLSGPEIGFSCYDLFPINTYNFTDYVLDSFASYVLLIDLLKGNGII